MPCACATVAMVKLDVLDLPGQTAVWCKVSQCPFPVSIVVCKYDFILHLPFSHCFEVVQGLKKNSVSKQTESNSK